jgi:hypothetical protein
VVRVRRKSIGRIKVLFGTALVLGAVVALPASAWAAPTYFLSIVEGSTTSPSYSETSTIGFAEGPEVSVVIKRGESVVARSSGGFVFMGQVPQVGDVVTLESPLGTPISSVTYDGLPSLDPTVCAGSSNFSGQRSAGATVEGGFYTLQNGSYRGEPFQVPTAQGVARVSTLSGSTFAGSFPSPLTTAQTVFATEEQFSPLPGGATFDYFSENERPVGACAAVVVPPPVVSPAPPTPKPLVLKGELLKLTLPKIAQLLKSGWLVHVLINQPGTVIQDLYLQNGILPAHASKRKPAVLVARGATTLKKPGVAAVRIRVNSKGRRALKHVKLVKLVLITTLRSSSGVRINLGRRTISLKR